MPPKDGGGEQSGAQLSSPKSRVVHGFPWPGSTPSVGVWNYGRASACYSGQYGRLKHSTGIPATQAVRPSLSCIEERTIQASGCDMPQNGKPPGWPDPGLIMKMKPKPSPPPRVAFDDWGDLCEMAFMALACECVDIRAWGVCPGSVGQRLADRLVALGTWKELKMGGGTRMGKFYRPVV